MNRRMRAIGLALAVVLLVGTAAPATANHGKRASVTDGEFVTLQAGTDLGYEIEGRGLMVRIRHLTFVLVRARGLDAASTYPTHVHNGPCAEPTFGGGHYQHNVGGNVNDVNEIWPFVVTNDNGRGKGFAWHRHRARPDAMSIVIHHPETLERLACADLS